MTSDLTATVSSAPPAKAGEAEQAASDVAFKSTPADRLFVAQSYGSAAARRRFGVAFAFCLLVHAGALYALLHEYGVEPVVVAAREIPVEVILEPPPPPSKPEPPPPKPKPPEIRNTLDLTPGTEIPRAANEEKVERPAPDEVSQAPRVAPSAGKSASAPAKETPSTAEKPASQAKAEAAPPSPSADKPDAEPVERVVKPPEKLSDSEKTIEAKPKSGSGASSMAALLAGLKPLPNFKIASVGRPAPVRGGRGANTYLNVLYGMIVSRIPTHLRPATERQSSGLIVFDIDGGGNILSLKIIRSSGREELDEVAIAAVRAAGPFPMTPNGLPVRLNFTY